ncbi:sporulation protein YqfC [Clostridium sp. BJN0001]|uniref:sporulation protein YqfC n=1 Tax=Clostridium sp. BJN0001 TaxID=2930219 RepID=UPI001FD13FB8|nr:sporulation protein YqfC [Clostridium sp. BJN0001]
MEKIFTKFDFPEDVSMDIPKVIILGNNQITIENHKGIMSFERNNVKINSKIGTVSIDGEEFEIIFIGENTITISGKFKGISYEK